MKKELIAVIVFIIICTSIVGAVFYFNENDIVCGILITDRDIPVGDNITLDYEIKNGMFAHSVSDVYLDIWVFHVNDTALQHGLLHYFIPIYGLNNERIKDQVVISAYLLDSGVYVIHTDLVYRTDTDHYKHLEIEFEIY